MACTSPRPALPACPYPTTAATVPLGQGRGSSFSPGCPAEPSKTRHETGKCWHSAQSQVSVGLAGGPSRLCLGTWAPGPGLVPTWPRAEGGKLSRPSFQEMVNHVHLPHCEPSASLMRRCLPSCLNRGAEGRQRRSGVSGLPSPQEAAALSRWEVWVLTSGPAEAGVKTGPPWLRPPGPGLRRLPELSSECP